MALVQAKEVKQRRKNRKDINRLPKILENICAVEYVLKIRRERRELKKERSHAEKEAEHLAEENTKNDHERRKAEKKRRAMKEAECAEAESNSESDSDSDSESFMFSKTRFYGGGGSSHPDDSETEEDTSRMDEDSCDEDLTRQERLSKPMDVALTRKVSSHINILEAMSTRFVNHMSKVVLRRCCDGCLISKYKSSSRRPIEKSDLDIMLQCEGIIHTFSKFRILNRHTGFSLSDPHLGDILKEFNHISQYMSLHSRLCLKQEEEWYIKSKEKLDDSLDYMMALSDRHDTSSMWFIDPTAISSTPTSTAKTPRMCSTPKGMVTPRLIPLTGRRSLANALETISEAVEEVQEVKTPSQQILSAVTTAQVDKLCGQIAANKKCLVCPFCQSKFSQHRNLTAHHRTACKVVKQARKKVQALGVATSAVRAGTVQPDATPAIVNAPMLAAALQTAMSGLWMIH